MTYRFGPPTSGQLYKNARTPVWQRISRGSLYLVRKNKDGSREYCCRKGHLLMLTGRIHVWLLGGGWSWPRAVAVVWIDTDGKRHVCCPDVGSHHAFRWLANLHALYIRWFGPSDDGVPA